MSRMPRVSARIATPLPQGAEQRSMAPAREQARPRLEADTGHPGVVTLRRTMHGAYNGRTHRASRRSTTIARKLQALCPTRGAARRRRPSGRAPHGGRDRLRRRRLRRGRRALPGARGRLDRRHRRHGPRGRAGDHRRRLPQRSGLQERTRAQLAGLFVTLGSGSAATRRRRGAGRVRGDRAPGISASRSDRPRGRHTTTSRSTPPTQPRRPAPQRSYWSRWKARMSWRDETPQEVQDDLDQLADESLSAATAFLEKNGEILFVRPPTARRRAQGWCRRSRLRGASNRYWISSTKASPPNATAPEPWRSPRWSRQ